MMTLLYSNTNCHINKGVLQTMDLKIRLKIKDVEIELDKKELKELKDILNELFPKEKEYISYPVYYRIYPWYDHTTYPYWTVSVTDTNDYTVTCNSTS